MFAFTSNVPAAALIGRLAGDTFRFPKPMPEHGADAQAAKGDGAPAERALVTVPNLASATGFMAWRS